MKNVIIKTFLLVLLFMAIDNCFSQDTTRQWSVGVYDENWLPPETYAPFWITKNYKLAGDTLLSEKLCKKLYLSLDSLCQNEEYIGAISQDSGKIYAIDGNKEFLLYDFTVAVQDTLDVYRYYNGEFILYGCVIKAISDTVIGGIDLSMIKVKYTTCIDCKKDDAWIQDIGSLNHGLLNESVPNIVGPLQQFHLFCYKINNELIYQNTDFNTCYKKTIFNNVKDEPTREFKIYPVPLTKGSLFSIESKTEVGSVQIYNMQGEKVYENYITRSSCELDLNFLNTGFYIVSVNNTSMKLLIAR